MTNVAAQHLTVEPIIHCPHRVESGKTYLIRVDLRPMIDTPEAWPYEGEEYAVHCHIVGGDLFRVEALGDEAVIVHRFGGTYGPAEFKLTALDVWAEQKGQLRFSLFNGWGVPMAPIVLPITVLRPALPTIPSAYYWYIIKTCSNLPLRMLDVSINNPGNHPKQIGLDQVYIQLDTTSVLPTAEGKSLPLSALQATIQHRRLVLLGDPGSGKSTFLNYLGLHLAQHNLNQDKRWLDRLPGWPAQEATLVPIIVVLRDFARRLPPENPHEPQHLWHFIIHRLKAYNLDSVITSVQAHLLAGNALILLDGLDEVPKQAARTWVCDAVQGFIDYYSQCRVIVTCRTLSYQNPTWQLANMETFTIDRFTSAKINQFIAGWYNELMALGVVRAEDSEGLREGLQKAIHQGSLLPLAANPLLLTVMAQIHAFKGSLPESRTVLYKEVVELLLSRWDEDTDLKKHLEEAKRNTLDLARVLRRIAYMVHGRSTQSLPDALGKPVETDLLADISESELINEFARLHPTGNRGWTIEVVELIKLRAGLLIERAPQTYAFAHRTFQEYLAGAYLAQERSGNFIKEARRLATQEREVWREVILLAVGQLYHGGLGDLATPLMLVAELCPKRQPRSRKAWELVWLAGEVVEKLGEHQVQKSELGRDLYPRVVKRLVELLTHSRFTPIERAAIGRTLGTIGDPRPGVGVQNKRPDLVWCEVPGGSFHMGGDRLVARGAWSGQTVEIPYTYHIAQYPVTYAQFALFVDAGGYRQEQYWTKAGWAWRHTNQVMQPAYWHDRDYHIANHPVVGLSWYECFAYTQWLTENLGYVVRLPTEAEWEKAARYPDGRDFPWGNELRSGAANVDETYEHRRFATNEIDPNVKIGPYNLERPTAVGVYADHASTLGLCDLSGNVWEWLLSAQTSLFNARYNHQLPEEVGIEGEGRRQMRGGCCLNDIARARLAYRASNPPATQDPTDGFRLVRDNRFSVEEWRQRQQAAPTVVEPTHPKREEGVVLEWGNGQGLLQQQTNDLIRFSETAVKGAVAYRTLHQGAKVTFEVDRSDPALITNLKRRFTGVVHQWDRVKAFGYIRFRDDRGKEVDIYMHQNDIVLRDHWERMKAYGDQVEFEIDDSLLYGEDIPAVKNVYIVN